MWLFLGRGLPASFCKEPNWNLQWAHARSSSTRTLESIFPEDRGAQTPRGQRKGPWGWDSSHTTAPCRECVSMGACHLSLRPGCCLVLRHRSSRPPVSPKTLLRLCAQPLPAPPGQPARLGRDTQNTQKRSADGQRWHHDSPAPSVSAQEPAWHSSASVSG